MGDEKSERCLRIYQLTVEDLRLEVDVGVHLPRLFLTISLEIIFVADFNSFTWVYTSTHFCAISLEIFFF